MVDVTEKSPTVRAATAAGSVRVAPEVVALLRDGAVPKGTCSPSPASRDPGREEDPELLPSPTSSACTGAPST